MKILKIILLIIITPVILFNFYILFTGKLFIYKAVRYNFVDIDDYKIFENKTFVKSITPQPWPLSTEYNQFTFSDTLNKTHTNLQSVAFLVIKNDSIQIEKYWDGYGPESLSNSFSMAKSAVSMLIGIAIKEGKIKSVDQPVGDFLPEFKEGDKTKITIKHLLMMSSGLDWDESRSYKNPVAVFFSDIMEGYYGNDLYTLATSKKVAEAPGMYFDYKSGDTQLLSFIIAEATGKSVGEYFREKLWQPLGAEQDMLWCTDAKGKEKAFCCINSNARDFARLGKLYLQKGWYNGTQIIDTAYVNKSASPNMLLNKDEPDTKVDFYGYQIWMQPDYKGQNLVYFRGTLGQLIILIPEKNIIIVRLGKQQGPKLGHHYAQSLLYVDEVNKMF
jgi:CubicO group peptidase (beta-lactamase class C family)